MLILCGSSNTTIKLRLLGITFHVPVHPTLPSQKCYYYVFEEKILFVCIINLKWLNYHMLFKFPIC
jgi:hypothetical protein